MYTKDQFEKEIVDNLNDVTRRCYEYCRFLISESDMCYGPVSKALIWAHIGAALANPGKAISIFAPPSKIGQVKEGIKRAVTHDFDLTEGNIKFLFDTLTYYPPGQEIPASPQTIRIPTDMVDDAKIQLLALCITCKDCGTVEQKESDFPDGRFGCKCSSDTYAGVDWLDRNCVEEESC